MISDWNKLKDIIKNNATKIKQIIKNITGEYNEDLEQEVYIRTYKILINTLSKINSANGYVQLLQIYVKII